MHYGAFEETIVKAVPIDQIMFLDLEIHPYVEKPEDILNPSRQIIGIGIMYFKDNEPTLFITDEEGEEGELAILRSFDNFIKLRRPLLVVGYGISSFDRPFLTIKMKSQYRSEKLWIINDMIERAHFLGLANPIRFYLHNKGYTEKPSFMSLEAVLEQQAFKDLPLRREEKKLAPKGEDFAEKGKRITQLWKENKEKFRMYLASDVYNCFVLYKFLYQ
ncbi:MAG: hypothetical protein OEY24_03955 [Candidatus Bathyarchaeota archaeon]|nr:hypothetical protein [Candidatus Bathyarchaeota archaeon]